MFLPHIVLSTLDRSEGAFRLFLEGRVSALVLAVSLREHARSLAQFDEAWRAELEAFADEVDAGPPKDKRELRLRFEKWLRETRGAVDRRQHGAAAKPRRVEPSGPSPIDVKAAEQAVTAHKGPSEAELRAAAQAELEALGLGAEDIDEVAGMTSEDIDRLLK